eukprot:TRINITY_DN4115_c1_g1_i11.p1 TRINITY_DN4115_c1_g1~~TRINITY_DN4115_c1_g1_i11.p1  ORF type:complete len:551 (-),score=255.80 TRINITY_DN4115_c1_g1_i11:81-1733(-)
MAAAAAFAVDAPMRRYHSSLNVNADDYVRNRAAMTTLVDQLRQRLQQSLDQGPKAHQARHLKHGMLLARDRVELLLDPDSPFLELCPLAGWAQDNATLGGSSVAGIGLVCGIECMVTASVPTLKGGAMNEVSVVKGRRIAEIAWQNRLPVISMVQSGGADLRQQSKVFHIGGGSFRDIARRSKAAMPTITVVFGSSTAGGAYQPGMSDYVIMVKNQAKVFLGGPPLVKMATGEVVDDESLGGAEMHSRVSGVSDYLADDEYHAIALAREIVSCLNYKKEEPLPLEHVSAVEEPVYDPEELLGIATANIRLPVEIREIIARIVDGSRFSEFKPLYGSTLVTCFARIHGFRVGILANNGVLFSEAANKGTQFIQLCNQANTPLIFLQNITGFMVGKKYEQQGIIKHGAQLINAVSNSGVPAITILVGSSYGAGNYGMCGRSYEPRFLFSWPNSQCSVMGAEQLSGVLDILFENNLRKTGQQLTPELKEMMQARKTALAAQVDAEAEPYFTSSRCIDDGIIDPRDTRTVLGMCLSVAHNKPVKGSNLYGVSRM